MKHIYFITFLFLSFFSSGQDAFFSKNYLSIEIQKDNNDTITKMKHLLLFDFEVIKKYQISYLVIENHSEKKKDTLFINKDELKSGRMNISSIYSYPVEYLEDLFPNKEKYNLTFELYDNKDALIGEQKMNKKFFRELKPFEKYLEKRAKGIIPSNHDMLSLFKKYGYSGGQSMGTYRNLQILTGVNCKKLKKIQYKLNYL